MEFKERQKKTTPKCARCRNHGYAVAVKGHSGRCPFAACACWMCSLITERTRILANQKRIRCSQPLVPAAREGLHETAQKSTHSGEMLPMPFQLSSHYTGSYVCPALLVSLQAPPPGTIREVTGSPYLPPSVLAYSLPGAPQAGSVTFYAPYPSYPLIQEVCGQTLPNPLSNKEFANEAESPPSQSGCVPGMVQGSLESDVINVDDDDDDDLSSNV